MSPKHQENKHYKALLASLGRLDSSLEEVGERLYDTITAAESEVPQQTASHLPGLDVQPIPLNFKALFPAKLGRLAISTPDKKKEKSEQVTKEKSETEKSDVVSTITPHYITQQTSQKQAVATESFTLPTQYNAKLNSKIQEKLDTDAAAGTIKKPTLKEKKSNTAKNMDISTEKILEKAPNESRGKLIKNDADLEKELKDREKKLQDLLDDSKGSQISSGTV